jgi:endonuclease/exonuclease/phosphatase family metal-dependent hydrolase
MKLKIGCWNLKGKLNEGQLKLIDKFNFDIVCFQEFTAKNYECFVNSCIFDWSASSLSLRHLRKGEGRARKLGCLIAGKTPYIHFRSYLLDQVALPERTLIAEIDSPFGRMVVCCFHMPPGVTWKEIKPQTFIRIANWLQDKKTHTVLTIDANTPKTDHPNLNCSEWHWKDEPVLMGPQPLHNMKDAYRVFLDKNPDQLKLIQEIRPTGPLAISYDRGRKDKSIPCRYDFIYVTPDIEVHNAQYYYEEAISAGSDHALVMAELELL